MRGRIEDNIKQFGCIGDFLWSSEVICDFEGTLRIFRSPLETWRAHTVSLASRLPIINSSQMLKLFVALNALYPPHNCAFSTTIHPFLSHLQSSFLINFEHSSTQP